VLALQIHVSLSPDPDIGDVAEEAVSTAWTWFTGWPLRVLLILVIGSVVLVLLRWSIRRLTDRIAKGDQRRYLEELEEDEQKSSRRRKIIVEEALQLVTPALRQRRARRARTVGSVLASAATIIIGTTMALLILNAIGAGQVIAPLLGTAGVVGLAVSFGAQSLVRDFLSGLFILIEDQYGVGDVVDLGGGASGTVEKMDLRLTHVRAFDGTLWHVRNGEILRAGNRTQQWGRAVAEVRVPVGSDVDVARAALTRAANLVKNDDKLGPEMLDDPVVRGVDAILAGSYTFTIHARVRPGHADETMRALLAAAYAELLNAGIIVTAADPNAAVDSEG
jgi:small conductance mechanosensitive channel